MKKKQLGINKKLKKIVLTYVAVTALILLLAGQCGGDPPPSNKDFSLQFGNITITQGQSDTLLVQITKIGGLTETVELSVLNPPAGIVANFEPQNANTKSMLTLNVGDTVVAKPYTISVQGKAAGVTHIKQFVLTVRKKPDNGAFELSATRVEIVMDSATPSWLNPLALTASGTSTITIKRKNGFAGAVKLSVQDLPANVTATFTPNNTSGDTSQLKITVQSSASKGAYTIKVLGESGAKTAKASFILVIKKTTTNPDFGLTVGSLTIAKGSTGETAINISRSGGFSTLVNLQLSGLPTGVTGRCNPVNANTSSALTLNVANTASPGRYTVKVTGTAAGKKHKASLWLTITSGSSGGNFSINAGGMSVHKGGSGHQTINITRTGGFATPVALSLSTLPTGITGSFSPTNANASTVLTINVSSSVAAGSYPITIIGKAAGKTRHAALMVIVTNAPDTTKPTIVSLSPENNAKGVRDDAKIVIRFSEKMNQWSIKFAFNPDFGSVDYSWSSDGKTVTITPREKLKYSGNLNYKWYTYTLTTLAMDLAGNRLAHDKHVAFATYRTHEKKINADKALDGHVWSGSEHTADTEQTFIQVGDREIGSIKPYSRGFLSFNLPSLPANTLKIIMARVFVYQYSRSGRPYTQLASGSHKLMLGHINYGSGLEHADFNRPLLDTILQPLSHNYVQKSWPSASVIWWVKDDYEHKTERGSRSQYRIQFGLTHNSDGSADYIRIRSSDYNAGSAPEFYHPYLKIWYYAP